MRIFLGLAAAAGALAIGTAAPARPAGGTSGQGAGPPGAWTAGGGHGSGWQARAPRAKGRRDGRHGGRRFGQFLFDGGLGLAGPSGLVAPWGNGFFAGGGGEVRLKDGRPRYDYDRSYPYEWAPAAAGGPEREDEPSPAEPRPRCTMEHSVRVCRGW